MGPHIVSFNNVCRYMFSFTHQLYLVLVKENPDPFNRSLFWSQCPSGHLLTYLLNAAESFLRN